MFSKRKRWTRQLAALTVLSTAGGMAHAANLFWLSPAGETVTPGTTVSVDAVPTDMVSLDLYMNFDEATLGGGIDFAFDPFVDFNSFSFNTLPEADDGDPVFPMDPLFAATPADLGQNTISFGNFNGIGGEHRVGQFSFDAVSVGAAGITMGPNDFPVGPFFPATGGFTPQDVIFYGANVNVVPELPVAWMLAGGVGFMAWMQKRHKS